MPEALQTSQGYPKITLRNDGGYDCKDKVYLAGTLTDFLAAIAALPATKDFGSLTLDRVGVGEITPWMDGKCESGYECEVLYSQATPDTLTVGSAGPFSFVSELEDSEAQRPIENHPYFVMQWGFHLATKPGGTTLPNFGTKTSPVMSDEESADNIWIRDQAERPTEPDGTRWTILSGQDKTKPQLQSFITDSTQIIAYRYDTSAINAADVQVAFVSGGRIKPSSVGICSLGFTDSSANWLCAGSSIKQEGFIYRVSVRLLYSFEGWDADVYEDITPT